MIHENISIGLIGAGNLATSIVAGLIANAYPPELITLSNPTAKKLDKLKKQFSVNTTTSNQVLAQNVDVIVLSLKPKNVLLALKEIQSICIERKPLIISVAAGVNCKSIQAVLGIDVPLIRSMPNIAAKVCASVTALYPASDMAAAHTSHAEKLFSAIGTTVWVSQERHIDAATAISGSGPAYFFLVLEAMQQAANNIELPEDVATALILQTLIGVGQLAQGEMVDLKNLRESVTSPRGTTAAALKVFQDGKLFKLFNDAIMAAYQRAQQLSNGDNA